MSQDVLERLRRANPVGDDVSVPPLERVLERLPAATASPARPAARWRSGLLPVLGVMAAAAVVAVALLLVGGRAAHPARPAHYRPPPPAGGGLPGVVSAGGSFAAGGAGVVSLDQCHPCQTTGPGQVQHDWALSTTDGGRTWHTARTPFALGSGRFSAPPAQIHGRDLWAVGSSRVGPGPVRLNFYVSHDGGATWRPARGYGAEVAGNVSIAGHTVWATAGGTCVGRYCAGAAVLRGSVSGDSLKTVHGSLWSASSALQVAAGSAGTAYLQVTVGGQARRTLVTRDGGRSWTRLPSPCDTTAPDGDIRAAGPNAVWQLCSLPAPRGTEIDVSADGGRRWFRSTRQEAWGPTEGVMPVSGRVAWALTDRGALLRTSDGGHSWQEKWSGGSYAPPTPQLPSVSPLGPGVAIVTATQSSGRRTRVTTWRVTATGPPPSFRSVPLP